MASYSNNRQTVRHQRELDQINCCGSFLRQKFGYRVTRVEVIQSDENLATAHTVNPKYRRASDGLWKNSQISRDFRDKFMEKLANFAEIFRPNFAE